MTITAYRHRCYERQRNENLRDYNLKYSTSTYLVSSYHCNDTQQDYFISSTMPFCQGAGDSHTHKCLCCLSFALKYQLVACTHIASMLFIPLVWRRQQQQLVSLRVCVCLCVWRSAQHLVVTTGGLGHLALKRGQTYCKGKVFADCDSHFRRNYQRWAL